MWVSVSSQTVSSGLRPAHGAAVSHAAACSLCPHDRDTHYQLVPETWGGGSIFKVGAGSELETRQKFVAALVLTLSVWFGRVQARCLLLSLHLNTSFISSVLLRRSVRPDHGDLIGCIPTYPSDKGPIQKLFFFRRGRSI